MLAFFRKYQRYVFIVVAVMVVVSFSFFGTHHMINPTQRIVNHPIGMAIDGSKLMRRDIDEMVRFLWSDCNDLTLSEKNVMPNFFNDGVIRKDVLTSGMGFLLVQTYFDALKDELIEHMEKHKRFRPYAHPQAPFISVENLWEQVLPEQKNKLTYFLQESHEMTPEVFALLVDLYLGESVIPPHLIRKYLLLQQKRYNWIEPDPTLNFVNLNLFHCWTLEDWFGSRFLELVVQWISNVALVAKERGYYVSYEEARTHLIRNGYEAFKIYKQGKEVSGEELTALWKEQLRYLDMDEKRAVYIWQKVMLFRRLFEDMGEAVFVDPHAYQTFHEFASKTAEVDVYHLPMEFEMKSFRSMMKLELYLDAISMGKRDTLMFPQSFASGREVGKTCPELVRERFLVEVSEVQKDTISLNVSMKEMWEWQLERENYELLERQFPTIALKKAKDAGEYFVVLEALEPEMRKKVDRFSRKKIVDLHPEWIECALNESQMKKCEVNFSLSERFLPFDGLVAADPLRTLFLQAPIKGELANGSMELEAIRRLEMFTSNEETYYRFRLLDRDVNQTILTFVQADEMGVLDYLLDKHLEQAYFKLRDLHASLFKTEDDEWKPFQEVQVEVGRLIYSDLLRAIESDAQQMGLALPGHFHEKLEGFYPQHRLYAYMRSAHHDIKRLGEHSAFVFQSTPISEEDKLTLLPPLAAQWRVVKESQVLKNHEKNPWPNVDVFSMAEQDWSDVDVRGQDGRVLSFFQVKTQSLPNNDFVAEMERGKAILSKESKNVLMREVLALIKEKGAIYLPESSSQDCEY